MSRSLMQEAGHLHFIEGQNRPLPEIDEEVSHPEPADTDRRRQIPDAEQLGVAEVWNDIPVDIDHAHDHQQNGNLDQPLAGALALLREQQRERQREMEEHNRENDVAPLSTNAA